MKLLLIIYSGATPRLVTDLLDAHGVRGYTELAGARGAGATGRREGTRAWPGDSAVFFTAVNAEAAEALTGALHDAAVALPPGERLHAAVMPVERFF